MNVRFIDTSVMANMLKIPGKCNAAESVQEEFKQVIEAKEVLILPIATIIETGNHIAHIDSGNIRRTIAQKFGEYLRKTAEGEAPENISMVISIIWYWQMRIMRRIFCSSMNL